MRPLVIKCTVGAKELERCNQAFTVAALAATSGSPTSLWLASEAAWLAVPGQAEACILEHAAPLAELRDTVLDLGTLTVCAQCAKRRGLNLTDLVEGARIAGATGFVEESLADQAQALVY